ncbi:MAG: hypothetical protein A2W31_18495 [Planctomycetes bacterium RBG_16_64_10]|nr:MAG: hypothetical protein A2W31_18495 [Planctomycetes bacterium RBG_16_64_10]
MAINRRRKTDRRSASEGPTKDQTAIPEQGKLERRATVTRRRQIDPTTCERDYTAEEIAFMNALDEYKRRSGRMFPTCSEVLEVIKDLGYAKVADASNRATGAAHGAAPDDQDFNGARAATDG